MLYYCLTNNLNGVNMDRFILKSVMIMFYSLMVTYAYSSRLTSDPDTMSVTLLHGQLKEFDIIVKIDEAWAETDYSGYIDYIDEFSKPDIQSFAFEDSLEWNSSGNLQWVLRSDSAETLNGSQYACVTSKIDGSPATMYSYFTSEKFDFSTIPEPAIEFEQIKTSSLSQVSVQISKDGSAWTDIYSSSLVIGSWSSPELKKINISREFAAPEVYLRFAAALPRNSGVWALDNIKIKGNNWLFLNDSLTAGGTVRNWMYEVINDTVKANINTGSLTQGLHQALIRFESSLNNHDVPVNLTVIDQLSIPEATIDTGDGSVTLSWPAVAGATSYKVFASDDPYGMFTDISIDGTFSATSWSQTSGDVRKFYYIKAVSE